MNLLLSSVGAWPLFRLEQSIHPLLLVTTPRRCEDELSVSQTLVG
jgi:hypothetical protein